MKHYRAFSYAQARLQARQGTLPEESLWERLEAIRAAAPFLQVARAGPMRPWVGALAPHQDVHEAEALIRSQWRAYVAQVVGFTPDPWKGAVEWFSLLPDLAVIAHLRANLPSPPWVRSDPLLHVLATELPGARAPRWQERPFSHFRAEGSDTNELWVTHWHDLWPSGQEASRWVGYLSGVIPLAMSTASDDSRRRAEFSLRNAFRRYAFTPAALFVHLLLVLFFLERLRGALARRLLFTGEIDSPA